MKVRIISIALVMLALFQCSPDKHEAIQGKWKIDSIYSYYNGFHFTRRDVSDSPMLEYKTDGVLIMSLGAETRNFAFKITPSDTLIHRTSDHEVERFYIQRLESEKMELKKSMTPMFKTANQLRFEIRYLSKQP